VAAVLALLAALLAPGPAIAFDRTRIDLGRVCTRNPVVTTFRVSNRGSATLRLEGLESSCGCTVADPGRRELAPGGSTILVVRYDPSRDEGAVTRIVTVRSNDPRTPAVGLELDADVVPPLGLEPGALYFRELTPGEPAAREVQGRRFRGEAPALKVLWAPPWMDVAPGPRGRLKVAVDPGRVPEPSGTVQVRLATGDPGTPEVDLPVSWSMGRAIRVFPEEVAFGPQSPPQRRSLVLESGRPFRILAWHSEPPGFQVEGLDGAASSRHALQVLLPAGTPPGRLEATLVLATDDPREPALRVPVAAWFDAPLIRSSPPSP
jgi:hypothetical protein